MMSKHWGEGQKWLAQRDFFNRQDQIFTSRDAANQLSIRQRDQSAWLESWSSGTFNVSTRKLLSRLARKSVAMATSLMLNRKVMLIVLVCRQCIPGASTWDLLGSSGASQGTGPGSLPGLPGAPAPSAGTMRAGPDPTIAAAKLQSSNSLMQTAVNAKLQEAQMKYAGCYFSVVMLRFNF